MKDDLVDDSCDETETIKGTKTNQGKTNQGTESRANQGDRLLQETFEGGHWRGEVMRGQDDRLLRKFQGGKIQGGKIQGRKIQGRKIHGGQIQWGGGTDPRGDRSKGTGCDRSRGRQIQGDRLFRRESAEPIKGTNQGERSRGTGCCEGNRLGCCRPSGLSRSYF